MPKTALEQERRYLPSGEPQTMAELKEHEKGESEEVRVQELLGQIVEEFDYTYAFMQPKFNEWQRRLKVYMNQTKKKSDVGSMLIFTIHQTLIAAMYNDTIGVKFLPRSDGDVEAAGNWEALAKYDYDLMEKSILDYSWIWDTTFFSYGIVEMYQWNDEDQCPIPTTWDITNFFRDPSAISITGKKNGEGKMRYCGRFIYLTKYEILKNIEKGVFNLVEKFDEIVEGTGLDNSIVESNRRLRQQAMGYNNTQDKNQNMKGANKLYKFLQWYTFDDEGKPILCFATGDRAKLVGHKEIKSQDRCFPLIDRKIHPMPDMFDGVSISDACEDKQRAIAILENLMLELSKYAVYSRYLYDVQKIPNKAELEEHKMNQYIGVKGELGNAIMEIPKAHVTTDVVNTMQTLQNEAEKATATPEIRQGVQASANRSATENAEISKNVDTRYGLNARVMTWSEKRFWTLWFRMYKRYFFSAAQEKIVRILGDRMRFRPMTKENLEMSKDPDIQIESMAVSELERAMKAQSYANIYKLTAQDPNVDKRYLVEKMVQYSNATPEEMTKIFPKTYDEYQQEAENEDLNAGKYVRIHPEDDDYTHLRVLEKANQNKQTEAHRKAHLQQLYAKKRNPQAQAGSASPLDPTQLMNQQGGGQPVTGVDFSAPNMLQTA